MAVNGGIFNHVKPYRSTNKEMRYLISRGSSSNYDFRIALFVLYAQKESYNMQVYVRKMLSSGVPRPENTFLLAFYSTVF